MDLNMNTNVIFAKHMSVTLPSIVVHVIAASMSLITTVDG